MHWDLFIYYIFRGGGGGWGAQVPIPRLKFRPLSRALNSLTHLYSSAYYRIVVFSQSYLKLFYELRALRRHNQRIATVLGQSVTTTVTTQATNVTSEPDFYGGDFNEIWVSSSWIDPYIVLSTLFGEEIFRTIKI